MDDIPQLILPRPSRARPLNGLTVLVVDDSRFASEAVRLLCLASGARIRRAGSLGAARRHLSAYRPAVAVVDLGLPDGSGLELIAELDAAMPRVPVILATSGEDAAGHLAVAAGADGFLAKPLAGVADFQQAILAHLPEEARPAGLRALPQGRVQPDGLSYSEDLAQAAEWLSPAKPQDLAYVLQFLQSIAGAAGDVGLQASARAAAHENDRGRISSDALARLRGELKARLTEPAPI